ncbi:MAG TPA: DUF4870 domain-containing protein [Polyangiaceae bacterium]|jgi:hypothetical protein|nr:DUF4870 domain-containing protein [Polyangiaceae bacterium]
MKNDRLAAIVAHAGTWFAWFLAPLLVWVLRRGESRYAEFHALQALLWSIFGTVVSAVTCGVAIPVFLAFHIYAAWKIYKGEEYEYPIAGELARGMVSGS